ncbi:MAG: haloacid dehalogenase-like hydrolase [Muribaculaceae bacterium]|nr:haloacid dehalogenase-like hydrolase [Muribaculaceae bacterium]
MQRIVAFDFDETITTHDSLPMLLKHSFGRFRWWWGVLCCLPWILLYKLRLCDGGVAKERLLTHFLKGMPYGVFVESCKEFASTHRDKFTRPEVKQALDNAVNNGDNVLVATASAREWVEPWLQNPGVTILSTELAVDADGMMTGRLASKNCNGDEKWRKIVDAVPQAKEGIDVAYGDSRGDKAMLSHAKRTYYRDFATAVQDKPWYERHGSVVFWAVMAVLVLYQLLGVFFGMDLADAGFYLTFYDNIFAHPQSVEYNFMYYLSGVMGGTLQSLFPNMGMVGMRLAGVAFSTLCGIIMYIALQRHIPAWVIALGCALVVTTFIAPPYTLSYDLCTILLYVMVVTAMWQYLKGGSRLWLLLAGIMAGLNVFVRMPNVLGLSLAFMPLVKEFVDARRQKVSANWLKALMPCMLFLLAAMAAMWVVLMVMPSSHVVAFYRVMNDLSAIASDTSGTASHTTGQMIMTQLRFYATELWTAVKLAVPVLAYWWAHKYLTANRWVAIAVKIAAIALFVWFVARMHPLQPLWVMCMAGCVAVIWRDRGGSLTWIAVLGLLVMLIMPLGSDGAYNNGSIIAWAAAPVAALWWKYRSRIAFPLLLIVVCAVRMVTGGAYFDGGSLLDKRSTIETPRTAGIYTTQERADAINDLLKGISPYVKPGTTLLAYGSIPTLNYLTYTHPYMGCSWPEQLSADMLQHKLDEASQGGELPLVLRQKFNTLGQQWSAPSESYLTDYGTQNAYQDNRKLQVLNDFLRKNNYVELYNDSYFILYGVTSDKDGETQDN